MPRLLLSGSIEWEHAVRNTVPLHWDWIGPEDPRLLKHPLFQQERLTPSPEVIMGLVHPQPFDPTATAAGPSTRRWEKSRAVDPEEASGQPVKQVVTVTLKEEPSDVSIPRVSG